MTLYRNTFRIESARLQNWNYGWAGAYFVTICTHNREPLFGIIENSVMKFSSQGIIADILWADIINHTTGVELGPHIVMPNHVHGIVSIYTENRVDSFSDNGQIGKDRFQNQGSHTVSSIIGSYKSSVSKHAHRYGLTFNWQSRFHDHIIRTPEEYETIAAYIINNPLTWNTDCHNEKRDT